MAASRLPIGMLGRRPAGAGPRFERLDTILLPIGLTLTALMVGILAGIDPKLAIAAGFGIGFAALVIADVTVGLCLFVVISFLEVLSQIGSFGITKVIGFLLAMSWFAYVATRKDTEQDFVSSHPLVSYVLLMLVAWAGLSVSWAEFQGAAATSAFRYGQNALLFLIVFTAVRERRHALWVVAAFVAGASVSAVFAVMNPVDPGQYDVARASGTIGDPNELAAVLVVGMILAGVLFATVRKSPLARLAALGAITLCAAGLFISLSRGGLVALGFAALASLFVAGRYRPAVFVAALTALIVTVGYFSFLAPPQARDRITKVDGGTGRTDIWRVGWRMVEAHPIHGVGSGNFQQASIHYFLAPGALVYGQYFIDHPKVAHNMYLHVLAELGIVGLALFLSLIAFSVVSAYKAARSFERAGDRDMELLARGLTIALLGLLAADFFLSGQFSKQLWLLLGLGPALLALSNRRAKQGQLGQF
jgi:putative inorganic carbon (hco3(-)) transporter